MRLLIATIFALFAALPLFAAEIEVLSEGPCFARLSGTISEGDGQKFIDIEQANPRQFDANYIALERNKLCLNSPGGSLSEGIMIAKHLAKVHIGTRIEKNGSCLSACALIFMMGRGGGENEDEAWLSREMDITARLGFHRPSLNLPEGGTYSSEQINNSFKLALDATLGFVSLANNSVRGSQNPAIPSDLFEEMFQREGNDFFYIDTVNKAGRWKVHLTGFQPPSTLSLEAARYACHNMLHWEVKRAPDELAIGNDIGQVEAALFSVETNQFDGTKSPIFEINADVLGPIEGYYCLVRGTPKAEGLELGICGAHFGLFTNPAGFDCIGGNVGNINFTDALAYFPPGLPITAIPEVARRIEAQAASTPLETPNFQESCDARVRPIYITNVKNFANVREGVGFEKPVVFEAKKDHRLKGFGDPFVWEAGANAAACRNACIASLNKKADASTRATLKQCHADNTLWYQVETSDGTRGFLSGKYLRF